MVLTELNLKAGFKVMLMGCVPHPLTSPVGWLYEPTHASTLQRYPRTRPCLPCQLSLSTPSLADT